MLQRSLFPDAFEVEEGAIAALEELDVARARQRLAAARAADPHLAGLDRLAAALDWLAAERLELDASAARVAALFDALASAVAHGELSRAAGALLEPVLARCALARAPSDAGFLDPDERVHRGALQLALGQARAAEATLGAALAGDGERRGELWGRRGDALLALQRGEEANDCYVRGLLLSAERFDFHRCRDARLAELFAQLRASRPERLARELVFAHGWLNGALALRGPDPVVDGALAFLRARAAAHEEGEPAGRARRFALLLYEDRSSPPGVIDIERREAMHALEPELFGAYIERCRHRAAR